MKKDLLAPNGKRSNLTDEQYKLVRTPEFKKWFGDWENDPKNASKVVDENGEPLVVYHGTNRDFNVFRSDVPKAHDSGFYGTGFYFTFNTERKLMSLAKSEASYYGRIVKEYFINARNPFDFSQLSSYKGKEIGIIGLESMVFLYNIALMFPEIADTIFVDKVKWKNGIGDVTKIPISILPKLVNKYSKDLKIEKVDENTEKEYITGYVKSEIVEYDYTNYGGKKGSYERTEDLGRYQKEMDITEIEIGLIFDAIEKYDGITYSYYPEGIMTRNPQITQSIKDLFFDAIMQSKYGDELVVFKSNQIKLADGTNTTFDKDNNDIRYNKGGITKSDTPDYLKFLIG